MSQVLSEKEFSWYLSPHKKGVINYPRKFCHYSVHRKWNFHLLHISQFPTHVEKKAQQQTNSFFNAKLYKDTSKHHHQRLHIWHTNKGHMILKRQKRRRDRNAKQTKKIVPSISNFILIHLTYNSNYILQKLICYVNMLVCRIDELLMMLMTAI